MKNLIKQYRNESIWNYGEESKYLLWEYVLWIMEAQSWDDFSYFADNDKISIAFVRGWMDWNSCKKEWGNE